MNSQFDYIFNESNKTVKVKDSTTKHITDIPVDIYGGFIYNDVEYIIFKNIITMRKHNTLFDFDDKSFNVYSLIPKTTAVYWLNILFSLCNNNIKFKQNPENVKYSYEEAIEELKRFMLFTCSELNSEAKTHTRDDNLNDAITKLVELMHQLITNIDKQFMLTSLSVSEVPTVYFDRNDCPAEILSLMIEYIQTNLCYKDPENHSFSVFYDMILWCMYNIIFIKSQFDFDLNINHQHTILHNITAMFVDLFVDRLTNELFIKKLNSKTPNITQIYYNTCPKLKHIHKISDISVKLTYKDLDLIETLNAKSPINMIPHIYTFNMGNVDRIKFLYDNIIKNKKTELLNQNLMSHIKNIPDFQKLYDIINKSILKLKSDYGMYDSEVILHLLAENFNI